MKLVRSISKRKINLWLRQHVAYRLHAAICYPEILPNFDRTPVNLLKPDTIAGICIHHTIHQGRLVAIRWLIEFIGIQMSQKGKVVRSRAASDSPGKDFGVENLPGGKYFGLRRKGARKLARAWKGCTQAVTHPTFDTRHPKVDGAPILEVIKIIIEWLEVTVYRANKLSIRDVL